MSMVPFVLFRLLKSGIFACCPSALEQIKSAYFSDSDEEEEEDEDCKSEKAFKSDEDEDFESEEDEDRVCVTCALCTACGINVLI